MKLTTLGEQALRLAVELGYPVFPLVPHGKTPLTARGFKDASSHPEQVAAWWDEHPHANIGLRTGDGLVVLDLDGPEAEHALARFGPLPETVTAQSARGRHLYFTDSEAP